MLSHYYFAIYAPCRERPALLGRQTIIVRATLRRILLDNIWHTPAVASGFVGVVAALILIAPAKSAGQVAPISLGDNVFARLERAPARTAWGSVEKARLAAAEDRHRAAISWYLEAVTYHPPSGVRVAYELGYQYACVDQFDYAISWFETAIADHPGDVEAHLALAQALSRSDRTDEALEHYRKILTLCEHRLPEVELGIARATLRKDELSRETRSDREAR